MAHNSSLNNISQQKNTTKGDGYDTYKGYFDPKSDVLPIVLALLIVFANSLVLILMSRKRYLRSNTNLLLCSLAVSDLLTGVVSVPLFITCNIVRPPASCIMEEQMSRFISASIVCHLTSVTIDRYLVIVHPLRYTSLVTRPRCTFVILFTWFLSAFTALVQLSWLDPFQHDLTEDPTDDVMKAELIYDIVFLALFFFLPFTVMSFTYAVIIFEIVRQSRTIQKQCVPYLKKARNRNRHEHKAVAIFAAMLFVYIICWLPYFGLRRFDISEIPIPLVYAIFWVRYLASLLNPCMYIIGKQDFRKTIFDHGIKLDITSMSKPTVLMSVLATAEEVKESELTKSLSRAGSRRKTRG